MKINKIVENNKEIAVVDSTDVIIKDVQAVLDLMIKAKYETGANRIIISKSALCEEFFDLSTKLADKILKNFITYERKLAIIGDFSEYTSSDFKDFIFECNNGKDMFFLGDEGEAIEKLSLV